MSTVNGTAFDTYSMEGSLDNDILFSVDSAAYFVTLPGRYSKFISEAAQFQTMMYARRSTVITSSKNMLVSDGDRSDMMPLACGALSYDRGNL
jgi:hypothetical protein